MMSLALQDAIVTLAAVTAVLLLVRPFLPPRLGGPKRTPGGPPCASCAAGAAAQAKPRRD